MFEKEAYEYAHTKHCEKCSTGHCEKKCILVEDDCKTFKDGAEFGYNKAKEDVKYDLMMKLKDEGIVKPLKDSIFRNERLSSQEQQELCAWIECAMDFAENLDECAKELEEAKKANEWHFVKDGDLPKDDIKLAIIEIDDCGYLLCNYRNGFWYDANSGATCAEWITNNIIVWKEIVLPELKESE